VFGQGAGGTDWSPLGGGLPPLGSPRHQGMASALGISEAEAQAAVARRQSRFDADAAGGQGESKARRRWLWHDSGGGAASLPSSTRLAADAAVLASGKVKVLAGSARRVVGTSTALEKAYERMSAGMLPNPVSDEAHDDHDHIVRDHIVRDHDHAGRRPDRSAPG
jgi:hypothetical protein